MRLYMYSVRDAAIGSYGVPFFVPAPGVATRNFTDEVNRAAEDNPLYRHPNDFDLYFMGEYDQSSGEFFGVKPDLIARGSNVSVKEVN